MQIYLTQVGYRNSVLYHEFLADTERVLMGLDEYHTEGDIQRLLKALNSGLDNLSLMLLMDSNRRERFNLQSQ